MALPDRVSADGARRRPTAIRVPSRPPWRATFALVTVLILSVAAGLSAVAIVLFDPSMPPGAAEPRVDARAIDRRP